MHIFLYSKNGYFYLLAFTITFCFSLYLTAKVQVWVASLKILINIVRFACIILDRPPKFVTNNLECESSPVYYTTTIKYTVAATLQDKICLDCI